jgi:hypothetical protein
MLFWDIALCGSIAGQSVVINELQNKNYRTIIDEDEDYEDWVEIINTSSQSIDLTGYGLTDNQTEPYRWIFPDMEIAPNEIILIFLSGKNRDNADSELHTNFSLSDSEELMLSSSDFTETDMIPPIFLLRDISYGVASDSELAYFGTPTPGAPNLTQAFSGICQPPSFSHPSGFYESSFNLSITADAGFEIMYSVDGSDPADENIGIDQTYLYKNSYAFNPSQPPGPLLTETFTSMIYDGPIQIEDVSAEPDRLSQKSSTNDFDPDYFPDSPSFKGMVVKARSTAPGLLPSEIVSKVFFVTSEGWSRYNLPVVSIALDERDLFQYLGGIHTAGQTFDIWRQNNPDVFPPPIFQANYGRRGDLWEKPAQIDFFDMQNESIAFSAELGIRVHGASSRRWPRKSFRLNARGSYNTDQINYAFFPSHYTEIFERLILRNSGSDEWSSNMRDVVVHRIAEPMRAITVASKPYYVFLNGEFYGLNNLREYIDDNYFKIRFGIDDVDLDLIKGLDDIQSGNDERYLQVFDLCENANFTENSTLDQLEEWVETESYIDIFVVNLLTANADMFTKNTFWWRDKSEQSEDDRFHSILVDLDRSLGHQLNAEMSSPDYNTVTHFLNGEEEPLVPYLVCFISAMENESFRHRFINRSADAMNTYFSAARTGEIINEMRDLYLPQYDEHIDRWSRQNTVQSVSEWSEIIDYIITFAAARPDFHRTHLNEYFDTGGTYELALDVSDSEHGYIHLNTIAVNQETEGVEAPVYPWEGIYFKNVAVTLTAEPYDGFVFSHWEGAITDEEITVSSTFQSDSVYVKAVFSPDTTFGTLNHSDHVLISVFPNPNGGTFQVEKSEKQISGYTLYDLAGRVIGEKSTDIANEVRFTILGSSGIYFLEIRYSDGTRGRTKVVKQ